MLCNHNNTRGKCGVNKHTVLTPPTTAGWWDSVLTPPLSAASSQGSSSCTRLVESHPCSETCVKLGSTAESQEDKFIWDRTPYDKVPYCETRCHIEERYHHGNQPDTSCHHGNQPDTSCHYGNRAHHAADTKYCAECDHYTAKHYRSVQGGGCCTPAPPAPPRYCPRRPCHDCLYTRLKKCKMTVYRTHSPLMGAGPGLPLNEGDMRSPVTINTQVTSTAQLRFPISYSSGRARAVSCEAVLSRGANKDYGSTRAISVQSDAVSSSTPSRIDESGDQSTMENHSNNNNKNNINNNSDNNSSSSVNNNNTVNRATSPFIIKMASQVQQIPNDPAVKSLVKSIVKFNDVEYQVPTKIIRRSKSQELTLDKKENIYWEAEETPLKPPQQSSFFCTPRRKEKRNVSADSVGSIAPLLKSKKSGGFFKSKTSSRHGLKHTSSCLNGKVIKSMILSRKTADNTVGMADTGALGVSRVRIFNANSDNFEAPAGRHSVQVPSNITPTPAEVNTVVPEKEKHAGKGKQSALGRFFRSRKSEGGVRWKINPEYYAIREGEPRTGGYVLPDDTFESVDL